MLIVHTNYNTDTDLHLPGFFMVPRKRCATLRPYLGTQNSIIDHTNPCCFPASTQLIQLPSPSATNSPSITQPVSQLSRHNSFAHGRGIEGMQ